jgi:Xaa-Pro aminopeptidase
MDKSDGESTGVWEPHVGYWQLEPSEQARLADKRERALALLPFGAVLVLCTGEPDGHAPIRFEPRAWARDLCEFKEPGSALVCAAGQWTLYLREPDRHAQMWEGYRLGSARAKGALGIDAKPISALMDDLKAALAQGASLVCELSDQSEPALQSRDLFAKASSGKALRPAQAAGVARAMIDAGALLEPLRMVVDEREAERMRSSARIAALGHVSSWEVMFRAIAKEYLVDSQVAKAMLQGDFEGVLPDWEVPGHLGPLAKAMLASGMSSPLTERLIEAAFLATCAGCGADNQAYAPIVAAGENALCLHWGENRRRVMANDWVLMDMGCLYGGFASDLTRTVPANGRFDGARGEVYRLLLDAQLAGIEEAVEGAEFMAPDRVCREILCDGLLEMGYLERSWAPPEASDEDWPLLALAKIFPHSTSHWIGRQVHDIGAVKGADGQSAKLLAGARITVEPGLYFFPDLPGVHTDLANFGARIEDVCLISKGGQPPEVLTGSCPKDPEAIERVAASCGLPVGHRAEHALGQGDMASS